MSLGQIRWPAIQYSLIQMGGGLDLITPTLSLKPGVLREALNFECSVTGGYTSVSGYERFDGQPSPSDATYTLLSVSFAPNVTVTAGDSIEAVTSVNTEEVLYSSASLWEGGLWVGNEIWVTTTDATIVRINASTGAVAGTIALSFDASARMHLDTAAGVVWAYGTNGTTAFKINYTTFVVTEFTGVANMTGGLFFCPSDATLWKKGIGTSIYQVDKTTFAVLATVTLGVAPLRIEFDSAGNIWAITSSNKTLYKMTRAGSGSTYATGAAYNLHEIAYDGDRNSMWVAASNTTNGDVFEFSLATNTVINTVTGVNSGATGSQNTRLLYRSGRLFCAMFNSDTATVVDTSTATILATKTWTTASALDTGSLVVSDTGTSFGIVDNGGTYNYQLMVWRDAGPTVGTGTVVDVLVDGIVLTLVTGTFSEGNVILNADGDEIGSITGTPAADTPRDNAVYLAEAADILRASIAKPSGSGPIRGVFYYNGSVYALRNNVGGTAAVLHKSSAAGWTAVTFYSELSFSSGLVKPAEGATLYGNTSTATGVVKRVVTRTGAWGSTAAGTVVIQITSGSFQNGESVKLGSGAGAVQFTAASTSSTITLLPGGRLETVEASIIGNTTLPRIYGADGVNPAWEFDGTSLVPIHTGMTTDTPKHIAAHKDHLWLSYGASLQYSGLADPYAWTLVLGAGEINAGEEITNLLPQPGSDSSAALAVITKNGTKFFYGTPGGGSAQLVTYNAGVGGRHYTAQNLTNAHVLDDRGVISIAASLNFGNFDTATLTFAMQPWIVANRTLATASCVNREKSQHRVFFSNGTALYTTVVNGQFMGALPQFFPDAVNCAWNGEDDDGNEITFVGSTDGWVYQFDKGTSFDGANISAYITLNYDPAKSPRILKSYRRAVVEVFGTSYAELQASYNLGYSKSEYGAASWNDYSATMMSGGWDGGVRWDSGATWDAQNIAPLELEMAGTAENVAFSFATNSNFSGPITITSAIVHYINRRGLR